MKDVVRSRILLYGAAAIVIFADQISKVWIVANLTEYETIQIASWLQPILSITPIRNTGGAFGMFPQLSNIFKYIPIIVVVGILSYQRAIPAQQYWLHIALGLVCGGALGNVIDRFMRGFVVDYFDVTFWPLDKWPLFNIADSAIVVGVAVMLLDTLLAAREGLLSDV